MTNTEVDTSNEDLFKITNHKLFKYGPRHAKSLSFNAFITHPDFLKRTRDPKTKLPMATVFPDLAILKVHPYLYQTILAIKYCKVI